MARKLDDINKRFADMISADAARELRRAAMAWAKWEPDPKQSIEANDRKGERLYQKLLDAAVAYAEARK